MRLSAQLGLKAFFIVFSLGALCGPAGAVRDNEAGVLLLHAYTGRDWELGQPGCFPDSLLQDPELVTTRLKGDGMPHLVRVYAGFASDTVSEIAAFSFGIRYSDNVRILSSGACIGDGMEIPNSGWPASGGGIMANCSPPVRGRMIPLYWFAMSAKGPGFFEIVPHPLLNAGARFASGSMPPHVAAITGFGKLGFDLEGFSPIPGTKEVEGGCCVGSCFPLSSIECAYYRGTFLGTNVKCDQLPCGENPLRGGCCLPAGCEEHSALDCARLGGIFLGEGVGCDSLPCPGPDPDRSQLQGIQRRPEEPGNKER
jgi:hypothetical protein